MQKSLEDGRKNSRGVYDGAFEEAEANLEDTSEDVARHNKTKDGKNRKTISSRECEIGGHKITIGENSDNGKQLALQLTDTVVSFIASWMQPLMRKIIDTYVDEPAASALDAVSESKFQLPSCPTPNVYDKVTWETVNFKWRCTLQNKPKDTTRSVRYFAVDRALKGNEFHAAKRAAYWEAVHCWNDNDLSTRHRIPGSNK